MYLNMRSVYATQTGNAREFSEALGRVLTSINIKAPALSIDKLPLKDLASEDIIIFICSTTGQGDEPDSMKTFWKFLLRRNLPPNCLTHLKVAVFGLGDSSYPKFNVVAKRLFKRLVQLGATPLVPLALGDDQHELGPDAAFDPWVESLKAKLLEFHPLPLDWKPRDPNIPPPSRYKILSGSLPKKLTENGLNGTTNSVAKQSTIYANIRANRRVTSDSHFQDVRLLTFDFNGAEFSYKPGDVLMVQPKNRTENVDAFFKLFPNFDPDMEIIVEVEPGMEQPSALTLPQPCTLRQAVETYFDIQSIPRRYFFELLSYFSEDELEKEKLKEFSSAAGQQDLYSYVNRPRRNILEVLHDFRHTTPNIPLEYIFELIPEVKARAFSIASSQDVCKIGAELLVAVVSYKTRLIAPRLGLCSNFLGSSPEGKDVAVWLKSGTVAFPPDDRPDIPVIMVGPGTGCAPFRSYIQHTIARNVPRRLLLFFGSRSEKHDFFFKEEWEPLVSSGKLELFTAFSRDQEDKIYVQHRIREQSDLLFSLIVENNAFIYVAGNSKQMPEDVRDAFRTVLSSKMSEAEACDYYKKMEDQRRIQFETWS